MNQQNRSAPAHKGREMEKTQQRPKTLAGDRALTSERSSARDAVDAGATSARESPSVKVEETKAVAGANGEKNLAVDWIDVWIGNAKPCRFDIRTRPGHELEVLVQQLEYKRTYTGTGTISTQPVPVVPIGTRFTITSKDTTTGETLEQKGIWINMGGGGVSIWQLIKRLLFKS